MTNYDEDAQWEFEKKADERLLKALKAYSKGERGKDASEVFKRFQEQLKSNW